ncbi:hypothetical protein TRVL_04634 [Trypanosoma vivax]|nr:hypothetical protein TRVL_04634 [Trypanosoma vivax]
MVAGKIGHFDEEYEIDRQRGVGVLPLGGPSRRAPQVVDRPAYAPHQGHGNLGMSPGALGAAPPVQVPPLQLYNANGHCYGNVGNENLICGKPISFPPVVAPSNFAPVIPPSALVSRSPLRFSPVLNMNASPRGPLLASPATNLFHPPPLAPHYLPPLSQPSAVPIHSQAVSRAVTPPPAPPQCSAGMPGYDAVRQQYGADVRQRPRSTPAVGPYPMFGDSEDPQEARRLARERAIEVQRENARLCEERRRQQQLERKLLAEEQRRQEELAHMERVNIGRKEQEEMKRERLEAEMKMGRRRGPALATVTSDAQLREDLKQQIEEKRRRIEEEKAREQAALAETVRASSSHNVSSSGVGSSTTVQPLGGLQHTAKFVEPTGVDAGSGIGGSALSATASFGAAAAAPPPSHSATSFTLQPFSNLNHFQTPNGGSSTPFSVAGFSALGGGTDSFSTPFSGVGTGFSTQSTQQMDRGPLLPSIDVGALDNGHCSSEARRLESHLQDMIAEHNNIKRMLETEVERKPGSVAPAQLKPLGGTRTPRISRPAKISILNVNPPPSRVFLDLPASTHQIPPACPITMPLPGNTALGGHTSAPLAADSGLAELSAEPSIFVGAPSVAA